MIVTGKSEKPLEALDYVQAHKDEIYRLEIIAKDVHNLIRRHKACIVIVQEDEAPSEKKISYMRETWSISALYKARFGLKKNRQRA